MRVEGGWLRRFKGSKFKDFGFERFEGFEGSLTVKITRWPLLTDLRMRS